MANEEVEKGFFLAGELWPETVDQEDLFDLLRSAFDGVGVITLAVEFVGGRIPLTLSCFMRFLLSSHFNEVVLFPRSSEAAVIPAIMPALVSSK